MHSAAPALDENAGRACAVSAEVRLTYTTHHLHADTGTVPYDSDYPYATRLPRAAYSMTGRVRNQGTYTYTVLYIYLSTSLCTVVCTALPRLVKRTVRPYVPCTSHIRCIVDTRNGDPALSPLSPPEGRCRMGRLCGFRFRASVHRGVRSGPLSTELRPPTAWRQQRRAHTRRRAPWRCGRLG